MMFQVDGMPVTKGSWKPGHGRGGRIVMRPDNADEPAWANAVAWAARIAGRGEHKPSKTSRFSVHLEFTLEPPPSARRTNRRDIDKLARSVLDALTGIVWADDEQVDHLVIDKRIVGWSVLSRARAGLVATITTL